MTYSGTVAGAMEGALLGIPAIAVSLERSVEAYDFSAGRDAAAQVAGRVLTRGLPSRTFLNVNVPTGKPKGFRVTVQAQAQPRHRGRRARRSARRSRTTGSRKAERLGAARSVGLPGRQDGYISVTPLQPDLTDYDALALLDELSIWREV